jgi:gliding motility-associated-like protein
MESSSDKAFFDLDLNVYFQSDYCNRMDRIHRLGILKGASSHKHVRCYNADDGIIRFLDITGGSGVYRYSIDGGANWQADSLFYNLPADTFDLRVKDFFYQSNVLKVDTIVLKQSPEVQPVISYNGSIAGTDLSLCPYDEKYLSSNQSMNVDSNVWVYPADQITEDVTGISINAAGQYRLVGYDTAGCSDTASVNVQLPSVPSTYFGASNDTQVYRNQEITYRVLEQNDHIYTWDVSEHGSISGSATGSAISVQWGNEVTHNAYITVKNTDTISTCYATDTLQVSVYKVPPLHIDSTKVLSMASCPGLYDGKLLVAFTGGEGERELSLEQNGAISQDTVIPSGITNVVFDQLAPGEHTLHISNHGVVPSVSTAIAIPVASDRYTTSVNKMVCPGDSANISVEAQTEYRVSWLNQAGDTIDSGVSFTTLKPGIYKARISFNNFCVRREEFSITPPDTIAIYTRVDRHPFCDELCNSLANIHVRKGIVRELKWHTPGENEQQILDGKTQFNNYCAGTYIITAKNQWGCMDRDTLRLVNKREKCLDIPTAFSPNNDGINEEWRLPVLKKLFPAFQVFIYDRWGNRIFHSPKGYPNPWDGTFKGTVLPMDSYHYIIELNKEGFNPLTGQVTIIR